jgi:hypothetical protein
MGGSVTKRIFALKIMRDYRRGLLNIIARMDKMAQG